MMSAGAQVVDALPRSIYVQEHLPGAISLPLESLDREAAAAVLDPARPIVTYCFDQHCDLSSRTAARLVQLGYDEVHDLIGGRAAWTVLGLPTEGQIADQRRIAQYVLDAPSVPIGATIADVVKLGITDRPVAVVDHDNVLLGALAPTALTIAESTPVEDVMIPAPGTIRPDLRVEDALAQLKKDGVDHVYVSTVSGQLVGLLLRDAIHV
jgi:rhodanese-related sulfurtransferase